MLNKIDTFLDGITMYRLVLYSLIIFVAGAVIFSLFGLLSFSPFSILFSTVFILAVCYVTNTIFSYVFEVPVNAESWIITALILALIITPTTSIHGLPFLFWASVLGISSKYILVISKKHIFNPAALGIFVASLGLSQFASWWMGTGALAPIVIACGLLIVKKIKRFDLVFSFFAAALVFSLLTSRGTVEPLLLIQRIILDSSLLFLGFIMLTEPLTTPPKKQMQIIYGVLVGLLFSPQLHFGSISFTPESALLIGNIFAFLVSPKGRLMLSLKEKITYGLDNVDFVFPLAQKISFLPGQYMEWTLPHSNPDSRGNRRYFTIASSPTENSLHLGIKFYGNGSSYKKSMLQMSQGSKIVGAQLFGDFTLPKNVNEKLVFVAGGVGITPYRSIIKYLLDKNEKRDIILLYSNKIESEIMYQDIFEQAEEKINLKTIYTLTEESSASWKGKRGRIDDKMIEEIPDWKERTFYLSGPHPMIVGFEQTLKNLGISSDKIKIDFFPGYV